MNSENSNTLQSIDFNYSITGGSFSAIYPVRNTIDNSNLNVNGMEPDQIIDAAWGVVNSTLEGAELATATEYVSIEII